jgi:hypothetical protein
MLIAIIVAEVAFWLVILLGLAARYVLRRRTLGAILLGTSPFIDLALLIFIVADLRAGAEPHWTHGLGAIYLGFSVVYGKRAVAWADRKFAAKYGQTPPPKVRLYGGDKVRHEWRETVRWWLACGLSVCVLGGCIALVGGPAEPLIQWIWRLAAVAAAAPLVPLAYILWPAKPPREEAPTGSSLG